MDELIARIEAATGPDRMLDVAIWIAIFANKGFGWYRNEAYTASLDAAMTLVPEGVLHILWGHRSDRDKRPAATVGREIGKHDSSLALALCAAVLRARMQESVA